MKIFTLILALLVFSTTNSQVLISQQGGGTTDPSAILELLSNNKGLLLTRLTTAQRLAIPNPAEGLVVYDLDKKCIYYYDGKYWQSICGGVNLEKGLRGYYKFDGNTFDSGNQGLHALPFGSPTYTTNCKGEANKAINFDGNDDYMLVADGGALSSPSFSVSFCYKTTDTRLQALLTKANFYNAGDFSWGMSTRNGFYIQDAFEAFSVMSTTIQCSTIGGPAASDHIYSGQEVPLATWRHFVTTFSNGEQKLYIDGVLRATMKRNFTSAKVCPNAQLIIGAWWQNDKRLFKGAMDELRLYDRELNLDEIMSLMCCEATASTSAEH